MFFSSVLAFICVRGGYVPSVNMSMDTYLRAIVPISALFAGPHSLCLCLCLRLVSSGSLGGLGCCSIALTCQVHPCGEGSVANTGLATFPATFGGMPLLSGTLLQWAAACPPLPAPAA